MQQAKLGMPKGTLLRLVTANQPREQCYAASVLFCRLRSAPAFLVRPQPRSGERGNRNEMLRNRCSLFNRQQIEVPARRSRG